VSECYRLNQRYITNDADIAQDARQQYITSHRSHRVKMTIPSTFFDAFLRMMRAMDSSKTEADDWAMNLVFSDKMRIPPD
jgi:hypothetical protein